MVVDRGRVARRGDADIARVREVRPETGHDSIPGALDDRDLRLSVHPRTRLGAPRELDDERYDDRAEHEKDGDRATGTSHRGWSKPPVRQRAHGEATDHRREVRETRHLGPCPVVRRL